ncbi:hypothetical protein H5410_044843 [Solanum commersonii]|uniref:Uncharacterized protein n=1 Tax=Solanum commersonii TaxID=4109 RepID=A0A9J5X7X5_SOLCO|nr:hypothetical protein H5410_044843 [Solanum commersonii]
MQTPASTRIGTGWALCEERGKGIALRYGLGPDRLARFLGFAWFCGVKKKRGRLDLYHMIRMVKSNGWIKGFYASPNMSNAMEILLDARWFPFQPNILIYLWEPKTKRLRRRKQLLSIPALHNNHKVVGHVPQYSWGQLANAKVHYGIA